MMTLYLLNIARQDAIMAVQEIIRMGHPTLRQVAAPYPKEMIGSSEFLNLVTDLKDTLHHTSSGIGLAAPQINVSYQVAVIEIEQPATRYGEVETISFSVFVNPKITVINPEVAGYWEGCLSVPGMMGFVARPQHILVDYLDAKGNTQAREIRGFLATVFQHEFDHLQGMLYVDRIEDMRLFSFDKEYQEFQQNQRGTSAEH